MPYEKEATKKFFEPEKVRTQLPWKLLVSSLIIFGGSLIFYFSLVLGYSSYLKAKFAAVKNQIEQTGGKINPEERGNILNLYSQITNISTILNHHIKSSNFFNFLEKNTLANVYFVKGVYDFRNKTITLEGKSPSYQALSQQMEAFKNNHFIKSVNLQDSFKKGEAISFSLLLSFDENLFNFKSK